MGRENNGKNNAICGGMYLVCCDSFREEDRTLNGIKSGITSWWNLHLKFDVSKKKWNFTR